MIVWSWYQKPGVKWRFGLKLICTSHWEYTFFSQKTDVIFEDLIHSLNTTSLLPNLPDSVTPNYEEPFILKASEKTDVLQDHCVGLH